MSKPLRFAIFGTGFWSRYQLAGWNELEGVECVALYNRTRGKAEALGAEFGVSAVYDDAEELLANEQLDFVDIITDVSTHAPFTELAAGHRLPVICQKPIAPTLPTARRMMAACESAGVPLYVHENWRWQTPIRAFKEVLESGRLGRIIRGRIDYANSYPVFENQPLLKELDQFILTDIGTHILDVARFLWGEATDLTCRTRRIHPEIKGEDVATVMMSMEDGVTVTANMSYASKWEFDRFPETVLFVEGTDGGATLGLDCTLKIFDRDGTETRKVAPPQYDWAHPEYGLVHASIVDCNRNLLQALRREERAETRAADNVRSLELVFAAYESAEKGRTIRIG
jgi:predicted dehydrogenase